MQGMTNFNKVTTTLITELSRALRSHMGPFNLTMLTELYNRLAEFECRRVDATKWLRDNWMHYTTDGLIPSLSEAIKELEARGFKVIVPENSQLSLKAALEIVKLFEVARTMNISHHDLFEGAEL